VKGYKSQGNTLSPHKVKSINLLPVIKDPNQSLIQTDLAPSESSLDSGQDDEDTPQIIIDF
jgi:hypothetical protein